MTSKNSRTQALTGVAFGAVMVLAPASAYAAIDAPQPGATSSAEAPSTPVAYEPSDEDFANPERGIYRQDRSCSNGTPA